jgi:hypothetical protein
MAAKGAVLTLPGTPPITILVGRLFFCEPGVALVFPAFGEAPEDTLVLKFDHTAAYPFGVAFCRGNDVCALLGPIEQARLEDPDDFKVAWQLWNEMEALRSGVTEYSIAVVAEDHSKGTLPLEYNGAHALLSGEAQPALSLA